LKPLVRKNAYGAMILGRGEKAAWQSRLEPVIAGEAALS
jgi:hypothetical protein